MANFTDRLNSAVGYQALYGPHWVKKGVLSVLPKGNLKRSAHEVAGATATFETGDELGERSTLTRVAAGAIIAGPVGAIVGAMFRKDRTRAYVTVEWPDGAVFVVDGPRKDAEKLQHFAEQVNEAANAVDA